MDSRFRENDNVKSDSCTASMAPHKKGGGFDSSAFLLEASKAPNARTSGFGEATSHHSILRRVAPVFFLDISFLCPYTYSKAKGCLEVNTQDVPQ